MINFKAIRAAEEVIEAKEADGYLILNPYNIKYICGIFLHGTPPISAILITKNGEIHGITSPLEENRAKDLFEGTLWTFTSSKTMPWEYAESKEKAIEKVLKSTNVKKVLSDSEVKLEGFEIEKDEAIYDARMIKDKHELKIIEKAINIAERALYDIRDFIISGVSEIEIAREIVSSILSNGGDWPSFDVIVASGPNAAYPHHEPTNRVLKKGDPVIVDLGAYFMGYASDLTRTFFVDEDIRDPWETYYSIVIDMQKEAFEAIRSDIKSSNVDSAARGVLIESLGKDKLKWYNHSTGHGIGLEVHEKPYIGPPTKDEKNVVILKEGMVFTIEPGIYIHRLGGIRIEDIVLVTDSGSKVLSSFPR